MRIASGLFYWEPASWNASHVSITRIALIEENDVFKK